MLSCWEIQGRSGSIRAGKRLKLLTPCGRKENQECFAEKEFCAESIDDIYDARMRGRGMDVFAAERLPGWGGRRRHRWRRGGSARAVARRQCGGGQAGGAGAGIGRGRRGGCGGVLHSRTCSRADGGYRRGQGRLAVMRGQQRLQCGPRARAIGSWRPLLYGRRRSGRRAALSPMHRVGRSQGQAQPSGVFPTWPRAAA